MVGAPFKGLQAGNSKEGLISVAIKPLPVIIAGQFGALAKGVRSYRVPLTKAIKEVVIPSIDQNFDWEGRPDQWEPLSGDTEVRRAWYGYGASGPILERSGKMRKAASAFARWVVTKDSAYAGGNWPGSAFYGPIQHSGFGTMTIQGGRWLPARPFMMIQNDDVPKIEAVFALWLQERALAAGFVIR
jgi:phage gpG-like protein